MSKNKSAEKMVACAARRKASGKHNLPGAVRRALLSRNGAEVRAVLPAIAKNVRPGRGGPARMAKGTTPLDYQYEVAARNRAAENEKKMAAVVRETLIESGAIVA